MQLGDGFPNSAERVSLALMPTPNNFVLFTVYLPTTFVASY